MLVVLVGGLSHATALPEHYQIVLGSYANRDIALRELIEFTRCKQPLYVRQREVEGKRMWRVVDGPYENFAEAEIVLGKWLACGHLESWVNKVPSSQS